MLTHLLIRDLAIVSVLELDLETGMTALTGETGAGKSIMIDALGLALGDKADVSFVRAGCEQAEVIAEFDLARCPAAHRWLSAQSLEDGEDCIVRRLLSRKGRTRAFINGRTVTTAQLRELANELIDIHSQHAHQSLLRTQVQRELLDAYGAHQGLLDEVARSYRNFHALDKKLHTLEAQSAERAKRLELLRFQVEELEALGLSAAQIESLDQEQHRLGHLERLRDESARTLQLLADAEPALEDQLRGALTDLSELATIDIQLNEARDLLETATIHVGEAAASLRHYLDGLDIDPSALAMVESQIARLHELARKYRILPVQLPDLLESSRAELDDLENTGITLNDLRQQRDASWKEFQSAAARLGKARRQAAERLTRTVTAAMQELGMGGGRFTVEVTALPEEQASASGLEHCEFMVSANPGQPLQPLAKVASGGELSRISLAIQVATAECASIPILVFDEVDVGIGGGVAEIVGRLLRQLGDNRQVLCVTHLPQVAAQAHHQLRVRKETRAGQTHACIEPLDADSRIEEIARMLGGTEITARTRDHASEMLSRSTLLSTST